jgi:site-specific DNA-cytosine methylase
VRGQLAEQGYATFPVPIEAAHLGAPYHRRRVFVIAHIDSNGLRQQPRRRPGQGGQGEIQRTTNGTQGDAADIDRDGQSDLPVDAEMARTSKTFADSDSLWLSESGSVRNGPQEPLHRQPSRRRYWWETGPPVGGMVSGLPRQLDRNRRKRIKALGNCVIPQVAQVIGELVKELAGIHTPLPSKSETD